MKSTIGILVADASELTAIEKAQARLAAIKFEREQTAELERVILERERTQIKLATVNERIAATLARRRAIILAGHGDFESARLKFEAELVKQAYRFGGNLTATAEILGLTYQALGSMLDGRLNPLCGELRGEVRRRRRSNGNGNGNGVHHES